MGRRPSSRAPELPLMTKKGRKGPAAAPLKRTGLMKINFQNSASLNQIGIKNESAPADPGSKKYDYRLVAKTV
jgi:hypothetical protein